MAESMIAASRALRVMGPRWSRLGARSKIPARLTRPQVGFMPVTPFAPDGRRIDPPVSEPSAPKARPAATETPDPLEETPDQVPSSHGLTGVGRSGWGAEDAPS